MATTRGERLRLARERRYKSARIAAKELGVAISTYGAHERAESPGGRDYGPDEARFYARRLGVTPEWLLTGRWLGPDGKPVKVDEPEKVTVRLRVPVVGYVGAGSKAHFYDVAQGDLDEVEPPEGSTRATVAVEIRGDSLGPFFNRWLAFYDEMRNPVTDDLIGDLCVVGLEDGRILLKQLQRGRSPGLFNLASTTEKTLHDVAVSWAAKVSSISRRR
ncbi:MAG TPA: XRE family transcriptional regulator [Xanthobacteraceae bacterium]|jgi:phage repressor protein C with HTH and peptisase S24 domain